MKFDEVPFVPCNDCTTYESCTQEAYEQGRYDERAELQKAFEHLYGSEYSFQELCDYADKLKTKE